MSLRRFLNGVHGVMLDGCADEAEQDALELAMTVEPEPEAQMSWEARIRAAGGEIGQ